MPLAGVWGPWLSALKARASTFSFDNPVPVTEL